MKAWTITALPVETPPSIQANDALVSIGDTQVSGIWMLPCPCHQPVSCLTAITPLLMNDSQESPILMMIDGAPICHQKVLPTSK